MKKAIMFIALVATSMVGANAQKFQGGEKNLEVEFNPLSDKPIGMPNGFRFRMFNSESSAIRVGFNVGGGKNTEVYEQQRQENNSNGTSKVVIPELYQTNKSFNFTIRPGYEKHFAGTDRLSPYVGAELMYSMDRSTLTREFHNANNIDDVGKPEKYQTWEASVKTGSNTLGLNALAGVDFYFADNFYLGIEINLGFQNTKYKDRETTLSDENAFKYSDARGDADFYQATVVTNNGVQSVEYQTIIGNGGAPELLTDVFGIPILEDPEDPESFQYTFPNSTTKTTGWGPNFQSTLRLGWLF